MVLATRHSTCVRKPVDRLIEQEDSHTLRKKVRFLDDQHNLVTQVSPNTENDVMYSEKHAFLIAKFMLQINEKITTTGICFGQQFMLHRGLKRFGSRGNDAAYKELKQLHDRKCFTPINID